MSDSAFIANGTTLKQEEANILLITGPNMAGKSTYMRQVALISIMAQIGSFVPAVSAEIPMIDRIFTRIGAADDLIGGQSTFMVEMADIQVMTDKATSRSLIIIDELGRGTSTSEGMAIAQAVIEYVHDHIGCKALVSTHFHELAHLEGSLKGLSNYCMAVQESGDKVHFLRKLIPGAADTSYGIYCARLAGLPGGIIERAYGLLQGFEQAAAEVASGGAEVRSAQAGDRPLEVADGRALGNAAHAVNSAGTADTKHYDSPGTADGASAAASGSEAYAGAAFEAGVVVNKAGTEASGEAGDKASAGVLIDGLNKSSTDTLLEASNGGSTETANRESKKILDETAHQAEVVQLSIFGDELPVSKSRPAEEDAKVRNILNMVKNADLLNMTPLEAMQLVNDLKMKAKNL